MSNYKIFNISKKSGGTRKIYAPDKELLKKQHQLLPQFYKDFFRIEKNYQFPYKIIHGFIPGRSAITAATEHIGYDITIMMDIKDFFDSIHSSQLPVHSSSLTTTFVDNYLVQGFATSPILANLSLLHIMDKLYKHFLDKYKITVYADDIQISIMNNDKDKISNIIKYVTKIFNDYNLQINTKKTRIRYAKNGYRRILGVNVGDDHIRATRKTMRKIRAAKHQQNKHSLGGLTTWSKCKLPTKKKSKYE